MSEMFEVVAEGEYDAEEDLLRCGAVTVEISDVIQGARKVRGSELREGDLLFDAFGGTHEIAELRRRKGSRWTHTIRHDGFEDVFDRDDVVAIIRPNQEV